LDCAWRSHRFPKIQNNARFVFIANAWLLDIRSFVSIIGMAKAVAGATALHSASREMLPTVLREALWTARGAATAFQNSEQCEIRVHREREASRCPEFRVDQSVCESGGWRHRTP
jgi:hypothetical protein